MKTCAKHDDWLNTQLADAEFAAEHLNAAIEDDDPASHLCAISVKATITTDSTRVCSSVLTTIKLNPASPVLLHSLKR